MVRPCYRNDIAGGITVWAAVAA